MNQWKQFFFGTPQRVLAVAAALAMVVALFVPGLMDRVVTQVLNELVLPLLKLAILVLVLVYAFKKILGIGGKKPSNH